MNSTVRAEFHVVTVAVFAFPRVFLFSPLELIAGSDIVSCMKHGERSCVSILSWFTSRSYLLCVPESLTGSNRFCEDWMHAFVNGAEGGNPFLFQQILENFKLKVIVHVW